MRRGVGKTGNGKRLLAMTGRGSIRRRTSLATLVAMAFGALVAAASASAGTLDQSQADTSGGSFLVGSRFTPAQTFTAGLGGPLDQVDVWATRNEGDPSCLAAGDLVVQIRAVSARGVPTSSVLGSTTISRAVVPSDVPVTPSPTVSAFFASPAAVTAGTQYAIVLSQANFYRGNCYHWYSSNVDVYPRGVGFGGDEGVFTAADPPTDLAFRTHVFVSCMGQEATSVGTPGNDEITGTPGSDVIASLGGKDKVSGLAGKDLICGAKGKDKLKGGPGKDKLKGAKGRDTLNGGGGKDKCAGGKGDDIAKKCEVERSI